MADVLDMDQLVKRLDDLASAIEDIRKISGTGDLSMGVLHQQEVATTAGTCI